MADHFSDGSEFLFYGHILPVGSVIQEPVQDKELVVRAIIETVICTGRHIRTEIIAPLTLSSLLSDHFAIVLLRIDRNSGTGIKIAGTGIHRQIGTVDHFVRFQNAELHIVKFLDTGLSALLRHPFFPFQDLPECVFDL